MRNRTQRQPNVPPEHRGEAVRWQPKDSQRTCRTCGENCTCSRTLVDLTYVLSHRQQPRSRDKETAW